MKKHIVIESDDRKNELDITYGDGDELHTSALLLLIDHAPHMAFITHGNSQKIARLIFGAYRIAIEKASGGSLEDARFVEMLEKVCEDIATVASLRKNKVDPDELLEKLGDMKGSTGKGEGKKRPH